MEEKMQHVQRPFPPEAAQIDALYRKHVQTILRFVRRRVDTLEEAEDIVLEVFTAALESQTLLRLSEQEQLAWLYRVASNKCIDRHRRATRRPTVSLDSVIENMYDDDEHEPDHIAIQQEEYLLLREHLTRLTEQQQEVLRLKFDDGLHSPEIARQLNKSESAVRMMLARTLNVLRTLYTTNEERRNH
jgi:RNA polymerase sigma factor (sigma-70 family)